MNCRDCKHWGKLPEGTIAPDGWGECEMGRLTIEKKDKGTTQRRHPRTLMVGHGGERASTVVTSAFFGCLHFDVKVDA